MNESECVQEKNRMIQYAMIPKKLESNTEASKLSDQRTYARYTWESKDVFLKALNLEKKDITHENNKEKDKWLFKFEKTLYKLVIQITPDFKVKSEENSKAGTRNFKIDLNYPVFNIGFYQKDINQTRSVLEASVDQFLFFRKNYDLTASSFVINQATYKKESVIQGIDVLRAYLPKKTIIKSIGEVDGKAKIEEYIL